MDLEEIVVREDCRFRGDTIYGITVVGEEQVENIVAELVGMDIIWMRKLDLVMPRSSSA